MTKEPNRELKPWQRACMTLYSESTTGMSKLSMPDGSVVVIVRHQLDKTEHCAQCLRQWYAEHNSSEKEPSHKHNTNN